MSDDKFSNKQNEVFKNMFGALKSHGKKNFTTEANAMILFDDDNFIRMYKDPDNTIVGTNDEIAKVTARAKYLELI